MSDQHRSPNNPFERPGDPSRQFNQDSPQQGQSRVWLWVLGTVGVLVVLGALVCCGGGYFVWQFGSEAVAQAMIEDLQGNPVIEEHIGEIQSAEMNLRATAEEQETTPNSMTFNIQGPKGEGKVVVVQGPGAGQPSIESAVLVLPDGTRHQALPLEGEPAEPAAPEEVTEPAEAEAEADAPEAGEETTQPQPETTGSNS